MRIAVISDIHGNYDAFVAVLKDIEQLHIETTYCLGDFVDYGPESEKVRITLQQTGFPTVVGNHELALYDDSVLSCFGSIAYQSTLITRRLISAVTLAYASSLPMYLTLAELRFVHGAPPDSPLIYIVDLSAKELQAIWQSIPETIVFVGHTHYAGLLEFDRNRIFAQQLTAGEIQLNRNWRYIINVGSVGQPREINKAAKYIIFDTETYRLETRWVDYNPQRTAELIVKLGYPIQCALRLLPNNY